MIGDHKGRVKLSTTNMVQFTTKFSELLI
jgi:hypothetical protein